MEQPQQFSGQQSLPPRNLSPEKPPKTLWEKKHY